MTETVSYTALRDLIDWYSKDGTKKGEVTLDALLELKHLRGILPDGPIVAWMDDRGGVITSAMKSQIEPAGSMPSVWSIPLSPTLRQSDTRIEGGGARVRPLDTAPSGEDAMEPSEIDVHEGAWALIIGTNGKPAGWVDTHALFAHQLYCDQILPLNKSPNPETVGSIYGEFTPISINAPTPEHVEGDVLSADHLLPALAASRLSQGTGDSEPGWVEIIEQSLTPDGGVALTLQLDGEETTVVAHFGGSNG